ncbi:MAG: hypothetical protein JWN61_2628 [Pseudonocardiales bacterium]|nr:hypothetical protein [Pseudonocardiales bacterium]
MTADIPAPSPESNPSTNDDAAAAKLCGMTHLPTGRVCVQPARHTGSCDFQLPSG